jgi:exopolyphosphatase / guanosine-5'-triphosphate,3'-diphosphate pyrophosphatase
LVLDKRRAIIDIGSNSVRLVVFGGHPRAPVALYNEKLAAGLGKTVIASGVLDTAAADAAIAVLARFKALIDAMHIDSLRVVATAAVRDASNGGAFLNRVRATGLPVELLTGDEEAVASGYGVISAIADADGIAADLGGGSLELVRISGGQVHDRISLPLGILRIPEIRGRGVGRLARYVQQLADEYPWLREAKDLPLYLVGGSWRSLARVHIELTGFPLPVIANHIIPPGDARMLVDKLAEMDRATLKQIRGLPQGRIVFLSDAAALLAALSAALDPSQLVVCASGLREGLLFQSLSAEERAQDPLIAGAQFAADQQRRFPGYGEALANWLDGLFEQEAGDIARLRHAACLLADLGWASNPDFRAIAAEELALHGNWVGVNAQDRGVIASALYASFGGNPNNEPALLAALAPPEMLAKARTWGLAIRLAHRLSGGAARILSQCPITIKGDAMILSIDPALAALDNGSVRRRLDRLASALMLRPQIQIGIG